jgi:hypothetical protein
METTGITTGVIGVTPDNNPINIDAELRSQAIKKESSLKNLNQAVDIVRGVVNENANPSPVLVAVVFAGVMIAAWIIYAMLLKPDVSGTWVDDRNDRWKLKHGVFGSLCATYNDRTVQCTLSDNMFKCGNLLGIWNYDDVIILVGGGNLTRVW